jgi:hypothetical protein
LTPLKEATDGGIALESDRKLVGAASLAMRAYSGEQVCARGPVGLVFGEPSIRRRIWHRIEPRSRTVNLADGQRAIDRYYG